MAVAVLDRAVSTVESFREMQEEIGVRAPNILYVSDAGRLTMSDLLFNTDNHEISDNRNTGRRHDEENENSAGSGRSGRSTSTSKLAEALGGKSWFGSILENTTNFLSSIPNHIGNFFRDLPENAMNFITNLPGQAMEIIGNIGDSIKSGLDSAGQAMDGALNSAGQALNGAMRDTGNFLSAGLNMVTGGHLGESREDIAARMAAEARVGSAAGAAVTAESREERLASATQADINTQPDAPDMFGQFMRSVGLGGPAQDQGAEISAPAQGFRIPGIQLPNFGMGGN